MSASIFPIPMWEQSLTLFCVILTGTTLVCAGALAYFRRVRMERPPVGTFNTRDVVILLIFIGIHNAWDVVTYLAISSDEE